MKIFVKRKDAMVKIRDLAAKGYFFYTSGEVSKRKIEVIKYKFIDRYKINANRNQRVYAKKKGQANVFAVCYYEGEKIIFFLLATEGESIVFSLEAMKDLRKKTTRLTLKNHDYFCLKEPRRGDKARYTWKMTPEFFNMYKTKIKKSIRIKDDFFLQKIHFSVIRTPGFSGARKQAFQLLQIMKNEWIRSRKDPYPLGSSYVGFIGRKKKELTVNV